VFQWSTAIQSSLVPRSRSASEGAQIAHVLGIFGRDNEPEMVPVIGAARGEILFVGHL